jgi:hypothetical protein
VHLKTVTFLAIDLIRITPDAGLLAKPKIIAVLIDVHHQFQTRRATAPPKGLKRPQTGIFSHQNYSQGNEYMREQLLIL